MADSMADQTAFAVMRGNEPIHSALRHALGWLVAGNVVGLWLAILQLKPGLAVGDWTYGRWVPVHLNVQLFGWTSLPRDSKPTTLAAG